MRRLDVLIALGRPVLIGFSRKSSLGRILGDPAATTGPLSASLGAAVAAYERGATILRAHDVRETVEALAAARAVAGAMIEVELHGLEVFGHHGVFEDRAGEGPDPSCVDVWLEVPDGAGRATASGRPWTTSRWPRCPAKCSDARRFQLLESLAGAARGRAARGASRCDGCACGFASQIARPAGRVLRRRPSSAGVTRAYVGLGANLGDREAHALRRGAIARVRAGGRGRRRLDASARPIRSGYARPAALPQRRRRARHGADAAALLDRLLAVERELGRTRDGPRFGPRTIDLDLLLYGDEQSSTSPGWSPAPAAARAALRPGAARRAGSGPRSARAAARCRHSLAGLQ